MAQFFLFVGCILISSIAWSLPTNIIVKFSDSVDEDLKSIVTSYIQLEVKYQNISVVEEDENAFCLSFNKHDVLSRLPKVINKMSEASTNPNSVVSHPSHGCL